jgi:transcriptional regulator with XRE-family HTH domain
MRCWRERLDPHDIPGLDVGSMPRRTISQQTVADLVGVSQAWYSKLERGEIGPHYSGEFLDRVAYVLRLSDDERTVLFRLAVGRDPAPRVRASSTMANAVLKRVIDELQWPAWISDAAWDLVIHNRHMAEWFPHIEYERNIMRWVFFHPQSQLQLIDWKTVWAPPMLAQMRAAHAQWPDNKRLAHLIEESLSVNDHARHLWENEPTVDVHPDGDRRRLHLPRGRGVREVEEVEIVALRPMRADDLRLVMLVPLGEEAGQCPGP